MINDILDYIIKLENSSFAEWSDEQKEAYLTACYSIKKFIHINQDEKNKKVYE
jgi:hypothetical protein